MRKYPFILIGLILLISAFSLASSFALAEDSIINTPYEIFNGEPSYYFFNSPMQITYNGESYAVFDSGNILVFGRTQITIPYSGNIKEMLIIHNYLLVLSDSYNIKIYNLNDGARLIPLEERITANTEFPASMSYDANRKILYIFGVTSIYSYSISIEEGFDLAYIGEIISIAEAPQIISSNSIVFADNQLLLYKIEARQLYSLDLSTLQVKTVISEASPKVRYITANNLYVMLVEDNKVTRYHLNGIYIDDILTTGEATDSAVSDIGGVSLYNNLMYVSNPSYSAVKVFTITSTGKEFKSMYGSRGTGKKRLNSPADVCYRNNTLFIADTMNDRVMVYPINSDNQFTSEPAVIGSSGSDEGRFIRPDKVMADYTNGLYVSDSTGRLQYFMRNEYVSTYNFNEITSLAVSGKDTVYAADSADNKIYHKAKKDAQFKEFVSLNKTPLCIAISKSGNILYVMDADGINAYSVKGAILPFALDFTEYGITNAKAVSIDYSGNIYILTENEEYCLYHFTRNISDYKLSHKLLLRNQDEPIKSLMGMSLAADGRIMTANSYYHNILIIASEDTFAITENSPSYTHPSEIINPTVIALIRDNTTIYYNPNNYEDINSMMAGECAPVLNEITYDGVHYYYIEYEGKKGYIRQSDSTLLSAGKAPVNYVKSLHPTMDIYLYPSVYSPVIFSDIDKNKPVEVISNVAEIDGQSMWNWYEVKYMNTLGYVLKTEIVPYEMPVITPDLYYAKIKSFHLGEKISLYSLPDSHSAVIYSLSDGTKVELQAEIDKDSEFTLIKYGTMTGYVRTQHLTDSGMTTGQILSLILAGITFTATAAVIIISRIIKKGYH